jgi:hypothetical protein
MSSRLRTGTRPGMGFFAFQDIITSVTGVLILVTLILASRLEVTSDASDETAPDNLQRRLSQLLEEQTRLEVESHALAELLNAAQTQPDPEKLEEDIAFLKDRIDDERRNLTALRSQGEAQLQATRRRDAMLGLTQLVDEVEKIRAEAAVLASKDRMARAEKEGLEQQVKRAETALLLAKSQQGQLWLIPDDKATTKEPILAVVAHDGVILERFDKPESRRVLPATSAGEFNRFLAEHNPNNQYVVFYLRPSGISLFNLLSEKAKAAGFEIGFDALDETTPVHFRRPPNLEESPNEPPIASSGMTNVSVAEATTVSGHAPSAKPITTNAPTPNSPPASPAKPKPNWWQRLLRAIGLH